MAKKILIPASIIGGIILVLTIGTIITKLTVKDLVSVDQLLKKDILHLAYEHYDNPLERIFITLGKGRIVSVNPPASAEMQFFTLFHIPLGILRGQPNARLGIFINPINPYEETDKIEKAKESVRKFMGNEKMDLVYSYFSYNPSNFFVGKASGQNKESMAMHGSREWMRPVYVFQEKRFINNDCQVYGYEVSAETFQVIQIQPAWPQWFQAKEKNECPDVYSKPAKDKEEVEKYAFDILKKDPEYTSNILMRSDIQPKFQEFKYSYSWIWEDESVSLPEGLTGDPFQHPVIRVMMTKDGRLDYYLNTTDLFKKIKPYN